jgi:hypothetical protein
LAESAGDGQTEADATAGVAVVEALKGHEDAVSVSFWHAGAVVCDVEGDDTVHVVGSQQDRLARRGVAGCVVEQVGQDAVQQPGVGQDRGESFRDRQLDVGAVSLTQDGADHLFEGH